jgi:hypothetical protein
MKSLLEVIKANKGTIVKRTLVSVGLVIGVTVLGAMISKSDVEDEDCGDCIYDEEVVSEVNETETV